MHTPLLSFAARAAVRLTAGACASLLALHAAAQDPAQPSGATLAASDGLDAPATARPGELPLTFDDAILLALRRPEAQEAQQVRAARSDADDDVHRWVGNPSVQVQVGRRRVPRADAGVEVQATLLQGFALGRVGTARLDALAAELGALDLEERVERMWAALEAGDAWLSLYAAEQERAAAEASVALGEQHLAVVTHGRALASSTEAQLTDAVRVLGELRMAAVNAESVVRAAALELAHATAQHGPLRLATLGDPPEVALPSLAGLHADESILDGLPTLQLQEALARVAAARATEVERGTRGTGALGLYIERDSPRGIVLAGVFQANFGFVDRGGRARSETEAAGARAEAQVVRAHHEAHGLFHAAIDAVELSERTQSAHSEQVVRALEQHVAQLARRLELGASTRPELLRAHLLLAQARMEQQRLDGLTVRARLRLRLLLDAARGEPAQAQPTETLAEVQS